MLATMEAAAYVGKDYQENLRTTEKTDFERVRTLFVISQKLILNHEDEIFLIFT